MDRVWSLARRCTATLEETEDLVQETYMRVLEACRGHRRPERVAPWLATSCLNVVRSHYWRRRRGIQEVLMVDPGRERSAATDTATEAIGRLDRELVQRTSAFAVTPVDIYGLTAAGAAKVTGSPRGTVLSRVHRGEKAATRSPGVDTSRYTRGEVFKVSHSSTPSG